MILLNLVTNDLRIQYFSFFVSLFFLNFIGVKAQQREYTTQFTELSLTIDGNPYDEAWNKVSWGDNFVQRMPNPGKEPQFNTKFKILFDSRNFYILVYCYDSEPGKVSRIISRRDNLDGDWVFIAIDSYNDKRTAFNFFLNAAEVKMDALASDDGAREDASWDPIWFGKTAIQNDGWCAEIKIPLSQLRFSDASEQEWGIEIMRYVFRTQEQSMWKYIPRDAPGWVSNFGLLKGIRNIKPQKQVEILPYSLSKWELYQRDEKNPFAKGKEWHWGVGVDGKVGITNNMILDFSFNPDFGQVEADPSEVNLTAFETYFQEKRPFFVEGNNIFDFRLVSGDGGLSSDNLFYSRRIGRPPRLGPSLKDNEFADEPENTTIISALKLSGKTAKGLSVGILQSLAAEEYALIDSLGNRRKYTTEPMTNFSVARLQKDYNKGNTILGGIITAANRDINKDYLKEINNQGYTGGFDFMQYFKNKTYYLNVKAAYSLIGGDSLAIIAKQRSSARYYQRPDANHLKIDSSLKWLRGYAGTIMAGKGGSGHFSYMNWITWRSPGFELNDVGYNRKSDEIQQVFWAQYSIWEPFSLFNSLSININQWKSINFDGRHLYGGCNSNINLNFKNNWYLGAGLNRDFSGISTTALRGGPALRFDGTINYWISASTSSSKKVRCSFSFYQNRSDNGIGFNDSWGVGIYIKPTNSLSIAISPSFSQNIEPLQYIQTSEFADLTRYICGTLYQKTYSSAITFNYCVRPNLTLQYYGEPFISEICYEKIKYITNSHAASFSERFHEYSSSEILENKSNNCYDIYETNNNNPDYTIDNPDMSFLQYRSNLVLRWEYIVGSSLYLIWSQSCTDVPESTSVHFTDNVNRLFKIYPYDVFLIKYTYCFRK